MIFKTIVLAVVTLSALSSIALAQDSLYVPKVHILNTKNEFETFILAGFEKGVSRMECEMRLKAWDSEMNFSATVNALKAEGQNASIRFECDPG